MERAARYWLAPLPAVRSWMLFRSFLLVFALDLFADHPAPGWRYGTAGFNVAHFEWMDRALPVPSSAFYVGMLFALGLSACVAALAERPPRALVLAIAAGYLWSWSCSMHDSYQHHYLLSLIWFAFATFAPLSSRAMFGAPSELRGAPTGTPPSKGRAGRDVPPPPTLEGALPHGLVPTASSFGLVVVWTTAAVVYAYTAVSKTEADWIGGAALRTLTRDGAAVPSVVRAFATLGLEGDALWWFLGHATVALQVACALGYACAPLRDRATGRARTMLDAAAFVVLFLALSFHLGAESLGLEIGWFSGYMIVLALVTFLPARALSLMALFATWPARAVAARSAPSPIATAVLSLGVAVGLAAAGMAADLPGVAAATTIAAVVLMASAVAALVRRDGTRDVRNAAFALGLAAFAMTVAMQRTETRYDYWRFAGGDFRRRGEWQLALDAYTRANRHAPAGQDRGSRIEEMRARIQSEGPRRAPHP